MVGHWYGGLGLAAVIACALFAAISGSSPATVVAIGSIITAGDGQARLSKTLRRRRHRHLGRARHSDSAFDRDGAYCGRDRRQCGDRSEGKRVLSASVGQLFMAGFVPGIDPGQHAGLDHVLSRVEERLSAHAEGDAGPEALQAFRDSVWGLALIIIVLGGIYAGTFTPTEAAAMSAVYAFVIAVFVYQAT